MIALSLPVDCQYVLKQKKVYLPLPWGDEWGPESEAFPKQADTMPTEDGGTIGTGQRRISTEIGQIVVLYSLGSVAELFSQ
jgi:hypothetical protein